MILYLGRAREEREDADTQIARQIFIRWTGTSLYTFASLMPICETAECEMKFSLHLVRSTFLSILQKKKKLPNRYSFLGGKLGSVNIYIWYGARLGDDAVLLRIFGLLFLSFHQMVFRKCPNVQLCCIASKWLGNSWTIWRFYEQKKYPGLTQAGWCDVCFGKSVFSRCLSCYYGAVWYFSRARRRLDVVIVYGRSVGLIRIASRMISASGAWKREELKYW